MYVQLEQSIYILLPAREYMSNGKYIHTSSLPRTRTQYPRQVGGHRILAIHHAPPPPRTLFCPYLPHTPAQTSPKCSFGTKCRKLEKISSASEHCDFCVKNAVFATKSNTFLTFASSDSSGAWNRLSRCGFSMVDLWCLNSNTTRYPKREISIQLLRFACYI